MIRLQGLSSIQFHDTRSHLEVSRVVTQLHSRCEYCVGDEWVPNRVAR